MMKDLKDSLVTAKKAAVEASQILRDLFETSLAVDEKSEAKGILTEADNRAEEAILSILSRESPFPILSEEAGLIRDGSGPKWVVDPLDGTTNFAHRIPFFGVSVALIDASEILLGVVADPAHGRLFYAEKGRGAYCDGTRLQQIPSVSRAPTIIVDYGYAEPDRLRSVEVTSRFVLDTSIRKLGSSAVELTHVASGHFDAFVCSGDELWDFAAGLLIAEEAGCSVTDWRGDLWNISNNYIIVARPDLHASIVSRVRDLQAIDGR